MFDKIKTFYGTSKPVPPLQCMIKWQLLCAATVYA